MALEEVGHHGLPHVTKTIRRRPDFNCTRIGLRRRLDQDFQIARRDDAHEAGIRRSGYTTASIESELQSFHVGPTNSESVLAADKAHPRRARDP